jgi:hypothetical protein
MHFPVRSRKEMTETQEDIVRKTKEIISRARSEGAASEVLETRLEEPREGRAPLFAPPDERVMETCRAVRTVAETVSSVPEYCKTALDEVAAGSDVAGVFRQEDIWLCVAIGADKRLEIHAVVVAQA